MSCQRCGSARVLMAGGKSSDCNTYTLGDVEREGYNVRIPNLGGGDYWSIDVCLECGQAQGTWPVETPAELDPEEQKDECWECEGPVDDEGFCPKCEPEDR